MKVSRWIPYIIFILFFLFFAYSVLIKYKADKGLTNNDHLIRRFVCEVFLAGKWDKGPHIPELPASPRCLR